MLLFGMVWSLCLPARAFPADDPADARIHTEDAHRFFDGLAAHEDGVPLRRALRDSYQRPASTGLRDFWSINIRRRGALSGQVRAALPYYSALADQLPAVEQRRPQVRAVMERLEAVYPDAVHPDVFVLVGRLNSGGTLTDDGLLIALDMLGRDSGVEFREGSWLDQVLKPADYFEVIVAHELVHYQQASLDQPDVLGQCLTEGIADFVGEYLSGRHINPTAHAFGLAHEAAVWEVFEREMHGRDTTNWLYGKPRQQGWPQDMGYFVGYRIAEAHFARAESPEAGIAALLNWTDAQRLLEESGYAPAD